MTTKQPPSTSMAATTAPPPVSSSTSIIARRQPLRQARTVRKSAITKSTMNGSGPSNEPASHLPPPKFYPALTAFTDAVDALPSEIIRHFTLLREVDAKACLPEANLRELIDAVERLPPPKDPCSYDPAYEAVKQHAELRRRRDTEPLFTADTAQATMLQDMEKQEAAEVGKETIMGLPETRRARCLQIRSQIADLLVTQDEKIHVITTAVEALQKHLARVEHAFAYVEVEIPALYRVGNPEHWAYKEPMRKGTAAQIARERERERRDQDERYHMQIERESNLRGDNGRRTGKHGNSGNNNHFDDDHEVGRKKSRKGGDNETLSSTKRIADQQAGAQQHSKKRKTAREERERASAATAKGAASPRAGTPVISTTGKKSKISSQRAARRPAPTPSAAASPFPPPLPQTANSNQAIPPQRYPPQSDDAVVGGVSAISPHIVPTESPALPAAPISSVRSAKQAVVGKENERGKLTTEKEVTKEVTGPEDMEVISSVPSPPSEAKEQSHQPKLSNNKKRAPSPTPSEATVTAADEVTTPTPIKKKDVIVSMPMVEKTKEKEKGDKDKTVGINNNSVITPRDILPPPQPAQPKEKDKNEQPRPPPINTTAGTTVKSTKPSEPKSGASAGTVVTTPTTASSKSRARKRADSTASSSKSKPSSAVSSSSAAVTQSYSSPSTIISRPSITLSKSHKKSSTGGSTIPASATAVGLGIMTTSTTAETSADEDVADGEETYCYCQNISYGEMVACDGEECEREWFHLDCVGLSQAPRGKVKWYCNDCRQRRRGGSRV